MKEFYIEQRDRSTRWHWAVIGLAGGYIAIHLVSWALAGFPVTRI